MTLHSIRHEFVEHIPEDLEDGVIYVSVGFATVVHRCCCGCGNEVVTPLHPNDWNLTFDGETISLNPSIGNWSFDCQSHYWIERNQVDWAPRWSRERVYRVRARERTNRDRYFGQEGAWPDKTSRHEAAGRARADRAKPSATTLGLWRSLARSVSRRLRRIKQDS